MFDIGVSAMKLSMHEVSLSPFQKQLICLTTLCLLQCFQRSLFMESLVQTVSGNHYHCWPLQVVHG